MKECNGCKYHPYKETYNDVGIRLTCFDCREEELKTAEEKIKELEATTNHYKNQADNLQHTYEAKISQLEKALGLCNKEYNEMRKYQMGKSGIAYFEYGVKYFLRKAKEEK